MQLNKQLSFELRRGLVKEFPEFLESCKEFLTRNFDNYTRVSFEDMMKKHPPYQLNLEECLNFMDKSLNDIDHLRFEQKASNATNFWGNEIYFPFTARFPEITEWGTDNFWAYRNWRDDLEYMCEAEFYILEINRQKYTAFADLNIFDDTIFEPNMLHKYNEQRGFQFDKNAWLGYLTEALQMSFPEFKQNHELSSKKMKRHLSQIGNDIWFGFEYQEADVLYELKKGNPVFPKRFNLLLLDNRFNKTEILSLGILGNPFFYQPCYPLVGYNAVDIDRKYNQGQRYLNNIIQVDSNQMQIIHSKAYGESIKKHGHFYLELLAQTCKPYLDYLKNVLLKYLSD